MGIQSSINSLLSQAQSLAAFYKGFKKADDIIKGQESQTEATKKLQESFENRYKKYKGIPSDVTLHPSQLKAVQEADDVYQHTGYELDTKTIDRIALRNLYTEQEELKNEVASNLARGSVEARTASINKTKSNFDEHTASLIKYYSKGSGNP